jgi:mono/diheme cytochrome c family protein
MTMRAPSPALLVFLALFGCAPSLPPEDLGDDPEAYMTEPAYRRAILERDLTATDNQYAEQRLALYGLGTEGWDALPAAERPSRPLTDADRSALADALPLAEQPLTALVPDALPATEEEWIALGRRVFFEYPIRADRTYEALAGLEGGLEAAGFLRDADDSWVGLRVFEDETGALKVGNTCAQCHASYEGADEPALDGVLSNRDMDIGAARLLVLGLVPGELPPEQESTAVGELDRLGPGRADVMPDGAFNPFAFPDFGGLGDLPLLHHNANWTQRGIATLAVRCETLFITSSGQATRIPRVLAWALAVWQRSLPPPAPLDADPSEDSAAGAEVFAAQGCDECHVPPLYSSDRLVSVGSIGTDPSAGLSPVRGTGSYRVPSLRGVGRTAPYLHDGSVGSLSEFLSPDREAPGHPYGQDLPPDEVAALISFLRGI